MNRFWVAFWAYVCLSLALVFYVPTLIPVKFAFSESYFFGYNNRVGFLLFVSLTALASLWWRNFTLAPSAATPPEAVPRRSLWIGMAAGLALCLVMYVLTARWGQFRDSAYFVQRIELISNGLRPYQDFEFAYGSSLLYLPLLLSRVLHLSIPNGYYLFWTLNVLVGIWMLYEVVNRVDTPSPHKNNIFALLCLALIPGILTTGTNYTGVRFLAGPLFVLIIFKTIRDGGLKSQIAGSVQAAFFTFLLLLISPELAIAFCLGVATFFFLFYWRSETRLWLIPYISMLLLQTLLMMTAQRLGVFVTFKSFANGGYNFPIVPAPHILMLFISVFFCACYIAETLSKRDFRSNTLLLLLVCLPSLAPAMGACDPVHVIYDAIGIFLICMLRVSNDAVKWNWYRFGFAVTFVVLDISFGQLPYIYSVQAAVTSAIKGQSTPDLTTDPVLLPSGLKESALAPFGYSPSHHPTALDSGYYFGTLNAFTPDAVSTKISEVMHQPTRDLVLPEHYDRLCHYDPNSDRLVLSLVLTYPFQWQAVHKESIYTPLCDYIQRNYFMTIPPRPDTFGYGIWTRKWPPS